MPHPIHRPLPAAAADLAGVAVFAAVGRSSHGEEHGPLAVLATAGPFLLGLVVGWVLLRAWRAPGKLRTGIGVWLATALLGLAVRGLAVGRLPLTFVLVALATLGVLLLGWRGLAALARRKLGPHPA